MPLFGVSGLPKPGRITPELEERIQEIILALRTQQMQLQRARTGGPFGRLEQQQAQQEIQQQGGPSPVQRGAAGLQAARPGRVTTPDLTRGTHGIKGAISYQQPSPKTMQGVEEITKALQGPPGESPQAGLQRGLSVGQSKIAPAAKAASKPPPPKMPPAPPTMGSTFMRAKGGESKAAEIAGTLYVIWQWLSGGGDGE